MRPSCPWDGRGSRPVKTTTHVAFWVCSSGFIPPSFLTVSLCLKDAFRPKTWLKQAYPDIRSDWPAHGVMRELVLDNGPEFHSDSLEQVCLFNGIEMHYAPRKTPWFKGKIERFFGTLNEGVAHGTPGTSFNNILEKGDYDPAKHAIVTFSTQDRPEVAGGRVPPETSSRSGHFASRNVELQH